MDFCFRHFLNNGRTDISENQSPLLLNQMEFLMEISQRWRHCPMPMASCILRVVLTGGATSAAPSSAGSTSSSSVTLTSLGLSVFICRLGVSSLLTGFMGVKEP